VETIGSKRSYALIWCMPNNDDERILLAYDNFHETKMLLRIYAFLMTQKHIVTIRCFDV